MLNLTNQFYSKEQSMLKTLVFFLLIYFLYHDNTADHTDHAHLPAHVEQKNKKKGNHY